MSVKDCDSHKLMYHPIELAKWINGETVPPIHAEIGITNRCNHRCKFCTLDWINHGSNDIDREVMMRCLKDMFEMGVKSIYYAGEGEPTLHSSLSEFINYAYNLGIRQSISTNGSRYTADLSEKTLGGLSWIRFSVDAGTSKTYSLIHGVSENEYYNVLNNIKDCVKIKNERKYNVDIGIQFILMPENIEEAESLAKIAKDIGVDNFQIKPAHSHPKSSYSPSIYQFSHDTLEKNLEKLNDEKFLAVVRTKSMERLTQIRNYKDCHGFHFYAIIDAKGNVVPCNIFYGNQDFTYGNISESSFKDIWLGEKRKNVIKKVSSMCFEQCGNYRCRLDVMNRFLERIKNPERNDEFI